jgi:hypothetical protein
MVIHVAIVAARAGPVAALYEQHRAHHVGMFPDLEDQLCSWVAGDKSPDRLDALVWAGTELMLSGSYGEISMVAVGSVWASGIGDRDPMVNGILQTIARRAAEREREQQGDAGAPQGDAEPEPTEAQLEHAAGLASMLGRLRDWGGLQWQVGRWSTVACTRSLPITARLRGTLPSPI